MVPFSRLMPVTMPVVPCSAAVADRLTAMAAMLAERMIAVLIGLLLMLACGNKTPPRHWFRGTLSIVTRKRGGLAEHQTRDSGVFLHNFQKLASPFGVCNDKRSTQHCHVGHQRGSSLLMARHFRLQLITYDTLSFCAQRVSYAPCAGRRHMLAVRRILLDLDSNLHNQVTIDLDSAA
jgi:hypothetical protein